MIERSKTKTKYTDRKRADRLNKKRRLVMEGLEARQLLAAEVFLPDVSVPTFTAPRNVGTVPAVQFFEREVFGQRGANDYFTNADVIPLGNGAGQRNTIDLTGSMSFSARPSDPFAFDVDIDTFAFDLKAGDILDISTFGTAGNIDVFYGNGFRWFGTDINQGLSYPSDSPLQTVGNAVAAQVIPEDGRYFLTVSPIDTTSNYTIGLRTYRPIVEQLPIGAQQVIFLDFDGGFYPRTIFDNSGVPMFGVIRVPSLQESLPFLGIQIQDTQGLNRLIDQTVAEVERQFAYLGVNGTAGDYNLTGTVGDYGVTILNSRDHVDPGNHPLVTRVLIGGDSANAEVPQGMLGVSSTLDVGNFSMDDIVFALLEPILPTGIPISPTASALDYAADLIALVASHEAVHSFGMRHTDENNAIPTIVDAVVNTNEGPDGIYGTLDDTNIDFVDDQFRPIEGFFGIYRTTDSLANTLRTGRAGGSVTGTVFADNNRDGKRVNEPGISGITVFADLDGNGLLDATDPVAVSDANGNYSLNVRPGTFQIITLGTSGFAATTPTSVSRTVVTGQSTKVDFGFNQVTPSISGTAFVDTDGDGIRDAGERGLAGVYVYFDLDGDNRPDLGEPGTNTASDGTYSLNFPTGSGPFTLRSDLDPGYERTFPAGDEHTVSGNGIFDFGFLPSQDFGDLPDSYGTTVAAGGAAHGIAAGLMLGATVDREGDGQPGASATGDDSDNLDDEDGVRLISPLGPGASATFEVTVSNTTGSNAFLQGFMDFNRDGVFGVGEQFAVNVPVVAGTVAGKQLVTINVPAGVAPGTVYTRFRLSQTSGLGAKGFVATGEVEDYSLQILNAAKTANDDEFNVARNTLSNPLDVLANDFQTPENPLRIDSINTTGTAGVVVNSGGQLFYTPRNGFIGRDVFSYTVVDTLGNRSSALVVVNVTFQSNVPLAVDDVFEVPQGSANRALNVLDNDVPSIFGGLTITSVTAGSAGGTLTIVGGGQSIRYTPLPGFGGTEQFTYSVQDAAGSTSSATVTVNLLPGSRSDDVVEFSVGIFDPVNINTPVSNVQVGDEILVRVSVDDLRLFANPQGVASAFLDLLYTDELISTLDTDNNPEFPFDITFGPLFSGINVLQSGNAQVPGLIDEVGGVQRIDNQQPHTGAAELFTLRMRAVSPGVAVFQADPANLSVSETVVLGSDVALTPSQLRLGSAELLILPASDNFTSAIDDSFPDGRDSDGNLITNASVNRNRLDVLRNDNLGPTGIVREFGLAKSPTMGNAFIDDNGTPGNLNDDFISYRANQNASGLETFTYVIVTDDNVRSTAEVTIALGNQNSNAQVAFDFALVSGDGSGTPISGVQLGDRFGVEIYVEDLRSISTFVFAGYLDVLYDSGIIAPADTDPLDEFDFDVDFGSEYLKDAGVGTAAKTGIIDEFGSLLRRATVPDSDFPELNPGLLATIYFDAVNVGTARVVGSPADSSPFQDTLLYGEDEPVERDRLRFDTLQITVTAGAPLQNRSLPQDVNNDGLVSPIDALLIINQMKRAEVSAEGEQAAEGEQVASYFTDVNGDSKTSALDALQVINYLKRMTDSQGNPEQLVVGAATSSAPADTSADDVFSSIGGNDSDKVFSAGTPAAAGNELVSIAGNGSAGDDDEDDVLSLLADDVSGLWG